MRLITLAGLYGGTLSVIKPTFSALNTQLSAALTLIPNQVQRDLNSIRAAIHWQDSVNINASAPFVTGATNNAMLDFMSRAQGLDDEALDILYIYLLGKRLTVLT